VSFADRNLVDANHLWTRCARALELGFHRQKVELFALHFSATAAVNSPHFHFQKYPGVAARKITNAAHLPIVPAHLGAGRAFAELKKRANEL